MNHKKKKKKLHIEYQYVIHEQRYTNTSKHDHLRLFRMK